MLELLTHLRELAGVPGAVAKACQMHLHAAIVRSGGARLAGTS